MMAALFFSANEHMDESMEMKSWPIGVIMSETGVTGAIERTQLAALRLAIDEINASGGVAGRPIEAIHVDPASTPAKYRDYAQKLCREQKIRVLFGGHMSTTRKAMLPVIEAQNALLFYPTLYEGFEYSRNCIYSGAAPNQNSVPLVDYLYDEVGHSILMLGSDYVYPYESNRIVADLFNRRGGKVLREDYFPLDLKEEHIRRMLDLIRTHKPDMIYSTIVGDGIVPFYNAFREAGFDPQTCPIASQSTSEVDVLRMKPDVADGHIIAAPFFHTLQTPAARAFSEAFAARNGPDVPATAPAEAAYYSLHLYARGLALAESDAIDQLLPALYEVEFDAPQGPVRIDRFTNHAHLWPRVARIRQNGIYDIVHDPKHRAGPDPYLVDIIAQEASEDEPAVNVVSI